MSTLLILADDFTGALDTGVQFAEEGASCIVTSGSQPGSMKHEVVSVNMECRHLSPPEAAHRVDLACRNRPAYCYKKTDSLLRGNVGAELAALMKTARAKKIMFVPAYPETGRHTRGGTQYLGGTPIHETAFAEDRRNPILESHIPQLIAAPASFMVK